MIETQYQQRITELESLLAEKDAKIAFLEEQFRLAQQKQFGASSECHPGQGELFNEAEAEVEQLDVEPVQETIEYTRNKPKRKPLPKDLPREVVSLILPMKIKSVLAATVNCIRLAKIRARSWNLSRLKSK